MTSGPSMEQLLVGRAGFALPASALQRAIARASDGLGIGDGLSDADVAKYFGCDREQLGLVIPALVVIVAGVRGGKSLLAGCAAVDAVLNADLSALKPHELARFAIVAPTVDNADATFRLLLGHVQAASALARLIVGEPTSDTFVMRRPDGRTVEVVVVAASRGAVTLRSRWLVGFVLDEVALFGAEAQGAVVNADELLRAGETRLVPGAQGWLISSPFGPTGLLYELWKAHFGKPGRVLVVHAPTRAMNPSFPAEQVEAIRQRSPDVAAREYDAAWLEASTALLSAAAIEKCTRSHPAEMPFESGHSYLAGMDAATRSNGWTLVVTTRRRLADGRVVTSVALAREWCGSKAAPLDPKIVLGEIAALLRRYHLEHVYADEYGTDFVRRIAADVDLCVSLETMSPARKLDTYQSIAMQLANGSIELPPVSDPFGATLRRDLLSVRKVARQGSVQIQLPVTPDGRHADFCPALALCVARLGADPEPPPVKPGTPEAYALEEAAAVEAAERAYERSRNPGEWFTREDFGVNVGTFRDSN